MVTEIRRAESDRNSNNAAMFYGYPYLTFYLEEIFCAHLLYYNHAKKLKSSWKTH